MAVLLQGKSTGTGAERRVIRAGLWIRVRERVSASASIGTSATGNTACAVTLLLIQSFVPFARRTRLRYEMRLGWLAAQHLQVYGHQSWTLRHVSFIYDCCHLNNSRFTRLFVAQC